MLHTQKHAHGLLKTRIILHYTLSTRQSQPPLLHNIQHCLYVFVTWQSCHLQLPDHLEFNACCCCIRGTLNVKSSCNFILLLPCPTVIPCSHLQIVYSFGESRFWFIDLEITPEIQGPNGLEIFGVVSYSYCFETGMLIHCFVSEI